MRDEVRAQNEALQQKRHAAAVAEWVLLTFLIMTRLTLAYSETKNARIDELRQQEKAMLEAQSLPLRTYMMKHIMPTLSQALIEVCKVRPEDPIDFLVTFSCIGASNVCLHGDIRQSIYSGPMWPTRRLLYKMAVNQSRM